MGSGARLWCLGLSSIGLYGFRVQGMLFAALQVLRGSLAQGLGIPINSLQLKHPKILSNDLRPCYAWLALPTCTQRRGDGLAPLAPLRRELEMEPQQEFV